MKNPWVIIGIVTIVLFGGAFLISSNSAKQANEGVVVQDQVKGNKEASVELVKYSDLQCPSCAQAAMVVDDILERHGDSIKFEYRHFPFLSNASAQAALAAEAAGQQGKFYEMHDMIFQNQAEWSGGAAANTFFAKYAEEIGLDMDQYRRHLGSSVLRDRIQSQFNGGREIGVTGTPTFFLNGERLVYETYEQFEAQIVAAISGDAVNDEVEAEGGVAPGLETDIKFGI
tara:strand:+ start:3891 stop:4577 length:687 start_codon:yes stop_codon:yes gene_type:complete